MRLPFEYAIGLLVGLFALVPPAALDAQVAAVRFDSWQDPLPRDTGETGRFGVQSEAPKALAQGAATRGHAGTGLLVGGLVGAAATTLFLIAFCSDPDTSCGASEVGRAAIVITPPFAAMGALIGSLVRTEE